MPRLIVNPGTASVWEIPLRQGVNSIGRGFANDFRLEHGSVSTSHCQIIVQGETATIKDLGSTNGTFVNGAQVLEMPLQPGQAVALGAVKMVYEATVPAEAATTVPSLMPQPARGPLRVELATAGSGPATSSLPPIGAPASFQPVPPPPVAATAGPLSSARTGGLALSGVGTRSGPALSVPPPIAPSLEMPPPPALGGSTETMRSGNCKFHPKTAGRYFCPTCSHFFCELCVASRAVGAVQKKFCRQCGTELQKARVEIASVAQEKGFYARIPGAFGYPFQGSGVLVLIIGTILISALQFIAPLKMGLVMSGSLRVSLWGLVFQVIVIGYIFSYMQNIIHSTAVGENEMPPLPSMANFWEDILLPCLKLLGLIAVCFLPVIVLIGIRMSSEESSVGIAIIPAFILSLLYFPMAFLAVAMLDSVAAANPMQVIPSILKAPVEYLLTVALIGVLLGMRFIGDQVIPMIFPRGLSTHNMAKLFGFLGAEAFWSVMCLYLLTVSMRILGLLYVSKKEKLEWL
jgi:hypothetical protein